MNRIAYGIQSERLFGINGNTSAFGMQIPRWMRLAMPEDVRQEVELAGLMGRTEAQRRDALRYRLRELRRTQWERRPCKVTRVPSALRPSKVSRVTGYRTNSGEHRTARLKVNEEIRRAIARKGAACRIAESSSKS